MLERKRQEYLDLLQQYYYIPDTDRGSKEQTTLRQILVDIPRTNADVKLFQNERIHQVSALRPFWWINCADEPFVLVHGASAVHLGSSSPCERLCAGY